jgi:hypothetical protein
MRSCPGRAAHTLPSQEMLDEAIQKPKKPKKEKKRGDKKKKK